METATQSTEERKAPPSDLIWGLGPIGDEINRTEEQAGYLARTGKLGDAAKKVGGQWVGSRSRLRAITTV
jgi:hypothetical protein